MNGRYFTLVDTAEGFLWENDVNGDFFSLAVGEEIGLNGPGTAGSGGGSGDPCSFTVVPVFPAVRRAQFEKYGHGITSFSVTRSGDISGFSFGTLHNYYLPGNAMLSANSLVMVQYWGPGNGLSVDVGGGALYLPYQGHFVPVNYISFNGGQFDKANSPIERIPGSAIVSGLNASPAAVTAFNGLTSALNGCGR